MKSILIILMLFAITGCGGGSGGSSNDGQEESSIRDMDLTGTWDFIRESRIYKISTGEYLYSNYTEHTYIIEETDDGTTYSRCWDYGGYNQFAVKTDEHLYFSINDSGYYLVGENSFEHTEERIDEFDEDLEYKIVDSLVKRTSSIVIDSGNLALAGPVSASENSHACLYKNTNSRGDERSFELIVPFGDDSLMMYLAFHGELLVGSYDYIQYNDDNQIYSFDVSSNATEFSTIVGSNTLYPNSASINISESSELFLKGIFSFTGQYGNDYSGTFEIDQRRNL